MTKHIALTLLLLAIGITTLHAASVDYGHLPLAFQPNRGQTDPEVRFLSRGHGYTLFLTESEAVLANPQAVLRMRLLGANKAPRIGGRQELPGKVHYFRGPDRRTWQTNIPTYAGVAYEQIYPGTDLLFYGRERTLEYDFVLAPGADPRRIRFAFDGAQSMRLDQDGDLVLTTCAGDIVQKAPVAYQESAGERKLVAVRYRIDAERNVAFAVGRYDRTRALVIDPAVIYSTFLGGNDYDEVRGIASDQFSKAYVTGATASLDFPNPQGLPHFSWETFVTRVDLWGHKFEYTTFIAASEGYGIAVDGSGQAYITGAAFPGFPATGGAFQTKFGGGTADAFVARLDSGGSLSWATFLGGSQNDRGFGIAVDNLFHPSVSGLTESVDFPTKNPFQTGSGGGSEDAFVSRFEPNGASLVFSSYLGGSGSEKGRGVAVDGTQHVYVAGYSGSPFVPNASQGCKTNGPSVDAFVVKVSATGSLVYARCVGGLGDDYGAAIAVDEKGSAYVAGHTSSLDFPVVIPIQAAKAGGDDSFVFRLSPSGSGLEYSTYLGGDLRDYASSIAIDSDRNAYVAGVTYSKDFPEKDSPQPFGGVSDAFVYKVSPTGGSLVYSAWLGGSDDEDSGFGTFVAMDSWNVLHVAGCTKSKDFPLAPVMAPNPAQPTHASPGVMDGWVVRLQ